MAQRSVVELLDDLDGTEATQTISFALNGAQYEIDLNDEHADEMYALFNDYIAHARRLSARRSGRRGAAASTGGTAASPNPQHIRDWAQAEGIEVSARGRISQDLRERYAAAHR
jgi:hypothetical protein